MFKDTGVAFVYGRCAWRTLHTQGESIKEFFKMFVIPAKAGIQIYLISIKHWTPFFNGVTLKKITGDCETIYLKAVQKCTDARRAMS